MIGISPSALRVMASYRWSGNVRDLEDAIARAVALSTRQVLGPEEVALKQAAIVVISLDPLDGVPPGKPSLELVVKTDARETDRKTVRLP